MRALVLHAGLPGERWYPLVGGEASVGRTDENDIVMGHLSLSRHHARVRIDGEVVIVEDRESKNGTWVNNARVASAILRHHDKIRLGEVELLYVDDTSSGLRTVAQVPANPRTSSLERILRPGPSGLNLASDQGDKRDREKLEILLDAAQQLLSIATVEGIVARVVEIVRRLIDADRVALLLPDPLTGELCERGLWSRLTRPGPSYSRSIARSVADSRTATLFADPGADWQLSGDHSILRQEICSALAAPLIAHDRLLAVLYVDNLTLRDRFTEEDLQFLVGFTSQAALAIENAQLYERAERESALRQNLLRFFPDAIAQRLLEVDGPSLAPVDCQVTALFCDLVDFTGHGARRSPRELLELLQVYLQAMAEVVFLHEGTMEKYIGDALMAVWGAPFARPDDTVRSVRAAIAMQRAMVLVNERVGDAQLAIHIGINTGPVCAGNIGSTRYLQYAAIGDATTTAARVCGRAKTGEILITEATRHALGEHTPPLAGPFDHLLKGHDTPTRMWRVRWDEAPG